MAPQPRGLRVLAALHPLSRTSGRLGVESLQSRTPLAASLLRRETAAHARTYASIRGARGSLSRFDACATGGNGCQAAPQRSSCLPFGPCYQLRAVHTTSQASTAAAMDPEILKHYLADSPPTIVPLAIKPHFEALNDQQKLYSHYLSMSARPAPTAPPAVVCESSPEP